VYGLSRLTVMVSSLNATRAELAQLAVIKERMRFARDLHDLLGYSLSAITLKAELTRRLVGSNPSRARDEVAELLDIARQALADVRLVASGYRNMSLSKEAASAASLLCTIGVRTDVEINCGALEAAVDTALATTLREAVTNMLRHSTVQNCTITADATSDMVRLHVINDGVPPSAASKRDGGGLENLAMRLEAVGGQLVVSRHDNVFDILATVAIPVPNPSPLQ
jgi:two-component system, NarL family, sensor histidine kinase DesK